MGEMRRFVKTPSPLDLVFEKGEVLADVPGKKFQLRKGKEKARVLREGRITKVDISW